MRTDRRYTRVREMLTDEAVPRLASGGIALCHLCQRAVYFAGGFIEVLLRQIENQVRERRVGGCCPICNHNRIYSITRYRRLRCAQCRFEWSETSGTAKHAKKKPHNWYAKIIELHDQGLNPHQISKRVGSQAKAVYLFLRRHKLDQRLDSLMTAQAENTSVSPS